MRARPTASATSFVIEQSGQSASGASLLIARPGGAAKNQGPGGGEFYSQDKFMWSATNGHQETGEGATVIVPGSNLSASVVMDPSDFNSGGVAWSSNTDGSRDDAVEFMNGSAPPFFGKSNALADLEALTQVAPIPRCLRSEVAVP